MHKITCHKCHHAWQYESVLGRADECPSCRWDAHVCLNCQFFDRNAHHQCRESEADFVKEKEESNFCDYFSPKGDLVKGEPVKEKTLSALDQLFGAKAVDRDAPKSSSLEEDLKNFLNKK